MVFLKFLNYFFSWRNYVVGQIENHFIYPGIPRKYMESFWYSQKKKNHYETNKSTLNLKYKGLNKNPISCEFYSEVLAKFLIVNQRVEGLSNTAFIPTVLSTGCGIERILCDNDKHLRMSSNLQMFDKCDSLSDLPYINNTYYKDLSLNQKDKIQGQWRKSENSYKERIFVISFLN